MLLRSMLLQYRFPKSLFSSFLMSEALIRDEDPDFVLDLVAGDAGISSFHPPSLSRVVKSLGL